MKKQTLKQAAQAVTGIALVALLAGQWALVAGPLASLSDYGRSAAEGGHMLEFFGVFGLNVLMMAGLPLVFAGIGLCVMAAYLTFERMQQRQAQAGAFIDHKE